MLADDLYSLYFKLPNFARLGLPGKAINRAIAKILKTIFDLYLPRYFKRRASLSEYGLNKQPREETYVVSLTSFPARIDDLWLCIETILRQSFRPDKVILWLAEEQFPDNEVPESLRALEERGLEIRFCDNLRSHLKYHYAIKENPEANVITLDDDIYYPRNIVENLVQIRLENLGAICSNRVHKILFSEEGALPYRRWGANVKSILAPSHLLVQTGVSGVLYPPSSLHADVFDKEPLRRLCYFADDLWLKVHAFRNQMRIVTNRAFNKDLITIRSTGDTSLYANNVFEGGNDQQLKDVCDYYSIDVRSFDE